MKTEKVFAGIFLLSIIFKLMHWPGSGPLIVVSFSTLSILYLALGFYFFCDKNIKTQNLLLSIVSGVFLSIIPIGLQFKIMYWPGAQTFLSIGLIASFLILTIVYFLKKTSANDLLTYYKNMQTRTLIMFILCFTFYLTPMSRLIRIQHWDNEELARLKIQHFENPDNEIYRQQYNDYINNKN